MVYRQLLRIRCDEHEGNMVRVMMKKLKERSRDDNFDRKQNDDFNTDWRQQKSSLFWLKKPEHVSLFFYPKYSNLSLNCSVPYYSAGESDVLLRLLFRLHFARKWQRHLWAEILGQRLISNSNHISYLTISYIIVFFRYYARQTILQMTHEIILLSLTTSFHYSCKEVPKEKEMKLLRQSFNRD